MEDNSANLANEGLEVIENEPVEGSDGVAAEQGADVEASPEDKPLTQTEASSVGRIVKKQLEKESSSLRAEIESLKATIIAMTPKEKKEANLPPPPVDGFPTTPEEFLAMKDWADNVRNAKYEQQRERYERSYITSVNSLRSEGGDLHAQIMDLLTKDGSPYNVTHGTGRGDIDAQINYHKAKADIISNKVKDKGNPFKGNENNAPIGVTASSRVPASKTQKVKFDDDKAEEFAKFLGLSDEDRSKVMGGKR